MAISLLGSTGGLVGGSDLSVDLTPYSLAQNDLVLVTLCRRATSNTSPALTTTGYTAAYANIYSNSTDDANVRSFYKVMGATPDTAVVITTTGTSNTQAYAIYLLRGVDTTSPLGSVSVQAVAATGAVAPNPPNNSMFLADAGMWIVAAGGTAGATPSNITDLTSPSNMTDFVGGVNTRANVGMALKTDWVSGAFDPNAFGGGGTAAGNSVGAATFTLKPAAGGGGSQSLTPSLFTNSGSFFGPTVASIYPLTAGLFTNSGSFFAPTVTTTKTLTPGLFSNSGSFFGPTVTTSVGLTAGLTNNSQTFYAPTVTTSITLSPGLLGSTETFFGPAVTTETDLVAGLFTNSETFYSPTVSVAGGLVAGLLQNAQTFYSPTVTAVGPVTNLSQTDLAHSYDVFFTPSISFKNPQKMSPEFKIGFRIIRK